jgi:hypothetical protein
MSRWQMEILAVIAGCLRTLTSERRLQLQCKLKKPLGRFFPLDFTKKLGKFSSCEFGHGRMPVACKSGHGDT